MTSDRRVDMELERYWKSYWKDGKKSESQKVWASLSGRTRRILQERGWKKTCGK